MSLILVDSHLQNSQYFFKYFLCSVLCPFFSLCFSLSNFYTDSSSSSLFISSAVLSLLMNPLKPFFVTLLFISSSSFFYIFYLCRITDPICHAVHLSSRAFTILMRFILNSLLDISNICIISEPDSVGCFVS